MAQLSAVEDTRQGLELLFKERDDLKAALSEAIQKLERSVKRVEELTQSIEGLEKFRCLLEKRPETLWLYLRDANVVEDLRALSIEIHKRKGELGDPKQSNDKGLQKKARLNLDYVATACVKFATHPDNRWKVFQAYLNKGKEAVY